ncbi:DUF222 domain-containing protein [Amycolatopsis sp. H20-H5]|uniref:DUF222 domain-containing protein n=1 Tax=Amycolatopsis sp. H20-H5 TaxID=3046309 RepID=UPI002DBA04D0|nr:DUF222 domain-containing protein [Amycolatopsis sp. H20-H5]MEC3978409.1 DUF222 domain-containing protein [Amycolatopsis sp. H20-H5]
MDADDVVQLMEGAAALIARLQALQARAVNRLDEVRAGSRGPLAEVALSLSVTQHHARSLVTVARALIKRLPRTLGLMESGVLDWYRASKVVEATDWLSDVDAGAVDEILVSRLVGKNATQVRRAACYAAMKTDPSGAERRAERRRTSRRLVLTRQGEGTATLSIDNAPVEKAATAYRRIDRVARALKTRDERRTLDQLRADVTLDLLLGHRDGGRGGARPEVFLYMDFNTYLGLNHNPVEMAGHGHLPAGLARYIATGPDTVLRRIITDPLTGQVLELGRTRYRPTASMDEFIRVRDRECRGVGCSRPAQACGIDHGSYPGTDRTNGDPATLGEMVCYCGTEHELRDEPGWHRTLSPDGMLTVTTPTGRSYFSSPEPLHEPRLSPPSDHDDYSPLS